METRGNVSISISSVDKGNICEEVNGSDFAIPALISLIFILTVCLASVVIAVLLRTGKLKMNQRLKTMKMRIVLMITEILTWMNNTNDD